MEEEKKLIDVATTKYLNVLDGWQREVDDIRMMHHEIWEKTQVNTDIIQHRTGSRVEKQTRISGRSKNTNIDWMFEVKDIGVSTTDLDDGAPLKIEWSQTSLLFGVVSVKGKAQKKNLMSKLPNIFTKDVFEHETEDTFLLNPVVFRDNVVAESGFDYQLASPAKPQKNQGPSLPGKGIVNAYDAVPCLQLTDWPKSMCKWLETSSWLLTKDWRVRLKEKGCPIFLVPTGDVSSVNRNREFRLSFSMLEIELFNELNNKARKMLGVLKLVFQELFSSGNLLKWFHVKYLALNFLEEREESDIERLSPLDFVFRILEDIKACLSSENIPHFFVKGGNVFPEHKKTTETIAVYDKLFENIESKVARLLKEHILCDLKINNVDDQNWLKSVEDSLEGEDMLEEYVTGYLTRLLSVITLPLQKPDSDKSQSIERIHTIFKKFSHNENICRLAPLVNECIERLEGNRGRNLVTVVVSNDKDRLAIKAIRMLVNYDPSLSKFEERQDEDLVNAHCPFIGIPMTKYYHDHLEGDYPLRNMIIELQKIYNGACPRFYLHPGMLLAHFKVLKTMNENSGGRPAASSFLTVFNELLEIVKQLSDKVPYYGKLSFRFTGMILVVGYVRLLSSHDYYDFEVPFDTDGELQRMTGMKDFGNFDLK